MNARELVDSLRHITHSPGKVPRLRELILKLGIQGQLATQDASDEPAPLLIKGEDRARPARLPSGWATAPLGEVASLRRGFDLPKSRRKPGKVPVFAANGPVGTHNEIGVKGPGVVTGRSGTIGKVHFVIDHFWPLNTALYVENFHGNDPQFIALLLRGVNLAQFASYTAVPTLNRNIAHEAMVWVPPLEEQRRIVAKVDELMALCDKLERQQEERERIFPVLSRVTHTCLAENPTPANLQAVFTETGRLSPVDMRRTILGLAIRGGLSTREYDDGNAATDFPLVARYADDAPTIAIPSHWLHVPLRAFGEWRGGGTPSKSTPTFWNGSIPWVSPKDMKQSVITETADHITTAAISHSSARMIPEGSVLLVIRGMILIRAFPVAIAGCDLTINQDMKSIIPTYAETKPYLYLALTALEAKVLALVQRSTHGTCKLLTNDIQSLLIPLPPLAEQQRILAQVDQLMALVDKLEAQQTQARHYAEAFAQAAVSAITGADTSEQRIVKPPKREVVSNLKSKGMPKSADDAPLAKILAKQKGELAAKTLWEQSGLEIADFYLQLRTEIANGWIQEPPPATVREIEAS
jgi:type I restriction enzyme, S subunit